MIVNLALVWSLPERQALFTPRDEATQAWLIQHAIVLDVPLGNVRRAFLNTLFRPQEAMRAAAMLEAEAEAADRLREHHGYPRAASGYRVRAGRYVDVASYERAPGVTVTEQDFTEYR